MGPRVLHAMAGGPHGGAEAFFERLVAALHEAGLEQRVVMRRQSDRAARLSAAGVTPREASFGGILDFVTPRVLRGEIQSWRPNVVLSWMSRASALTPSRARAGDKAVRVGRLGGYYDLKYYRGCDHLIANTQDIAAYIRRGGWPEERVHYLPNFVDETAATPVDRTALGVSDADIVALALGRFHPNKAFDTLLAALAQAPAIKLWLAGEGELRTALEAQAARLDLGERVRFLGWRDDASALIAAADMVIVPSRLEPLGNVVIEAWAQCRAMIAAASAGPAALIRPGHNGLLVPVDDAAALAQAMLRLAGDRDLRWAQGEMGHATYYAEFARAAVVDAYLDFFERVAA